eukprot:TRINITY_DN2221_c0_g1_i2.p1 TRINITY_DN2221_c0_g1~~TRINITY_DN2221_c0_g1_i2.p1  ORF type:complete len:769 (+),score=206.10 TRINITY_DN2221_c0_g1_i2:187-2493(+)
MSEPSTAALLHKVKILEDKLAAAEEEKGELTASKQEAEWEVDDLISRNNELSLRLKDLEADLEDSLSEKKKIGENLKWREETFEKAVEDATTEATEAKEESLDLGAKLGDAEESIETLTAELKRTEEEREEALDNEHAANESLSQMGKEMASLKEDLAELQAEISAGVGARATLEEELSSKTSEALSLQSQCGDLQKINVEVNQKATSLQEEVSKLERSVKDLTSELEVVRRLGNRQEEELRALRSESHEEVRSRLRAEESAESLKSKLLAMSESLETSSSLTDNLTKEEHESRLKAINLKLSLAEGRNEDLEAELATLRKKYKTLLEASEASPGASNRRNADLETEIEEVRNSLLLAKKENSRLASGHRKDLAVARAAQAQAEAEAASLRASSQRRRLSSASDSSQARSASDSYLKARLKDADNELKHLRDSSAAASDTELSELKSANLSLEASLDEANETIATLRSRAVISNGQPGDPNEMVSAANERADQADQRMLRAEQASSKVAKLSQQVIDAAAKQRAEDKLKLRLAEETISTLRAQLNELKSNVESERKAFADAAENTDNKEKLAALSATADGLSKRLDESLKSDASSVVALQTALESLTTSITNERVESAADLTKHNKQVKEATNAAEAQKLSAEQTVLEAEKSVHDARHSRDESLAAWREAVQRLAEAEAKVLNTEARIVPLEDEIAELRSVLNSQNSSNANSAALTSELSRSRTELHDLAAKHRSARIEALEKALAEARKDAHQARVAAIQAAPLSSF